MRWLLLLASMPGTPAGSGGLTKASQPLGTQMRRLMRPVASGAETATQPGKPERETSTRGPSEPLATTSACSRKRSVVSAGNLQAVLVHAARGSALSVLQTLLAHEGQAEPASISGLLMPAQCSCMHSKLTVRASTRPPLCSTACCPSAASLACSPQLAV